MTDEAQQRLGETESLAQQRGVEAEMLLNATIDEAKQETDAAKSRAAEAEKRVIEAKELLDKAKSDVESEKSRVAASQKRAIQAKATAEREAKRRKKAEEAYAREKKRREEAQEDVARQANDAEVSTDITAKLIEVLCRGTGQMSTQGQQRVFAALRERALGGLFTFNGDPFPAQVGQQQPGPSELRVVPMQPSAQICFESNAASDNANNAPGLAAVQGPGARIQTRQQAVNSEQPGASDDEIEMMQELGESSTARQLAW